MEIQCQAVLHSHRLCNADDPWDQILHYRGQGFARRVDGTHRNLGEAWEVFHVYRQILLDAFRYIYAKGQRQGNCRRALHLWVEVT